MTTGFAKLAWAAICIDWEAATSPLDTYLGLRRLQK
jgi:hypothetical protein